MWNIEPNDKIETEKDLNQVDNNDVMASQAHLRNVFYRMGFGDEGIVALSGAHTLGRAHKVRGGRSERAELAPCLCVELMNSRDLDEYILKYRSNTIIDK